VLGIFAGKGCANLHGRPSWQTQRVTCQKKINNPFANLIASKFQSDATGFLFYFRCRLIE
jgi:hypothetical protein